MSNKEYIYDNSGSIVDGPQHRYLLNNLVYHEFSGETADAIKYFPKSIGGKYNSLKKLNKRNKEALQNPHLSVGMPQFDILSNIVDDTTKKYNHLMNNEKNCVIHLRLGDGVDEFYISIGYAPFKETVVNEYVQRFVPNDYSIDIIHVPYTALCGARTAKCIKKTVNYVNNLVDLLKSKYSKINIFNESHPDIDFCRIINADIFVAGIGGFTNLARSLRKYKGLATVSIPDDDVRLRYGGSD